MTTDISPTKNAQELTNIRFSFLNPPTSSCSLFMIICASTPGKTYFICGPCPRNLMSNKKKTWLLFYFITSIFPLKTLVWNKITLYYKFWPISAYLTRPKTVISFISLDPSGKRLWESFFATAILKYPKILDFSWLAPFPRPTMISSYGMDH